MMESQLTLVFIISFLSLVHGYTPTFRNEATHPLKAPTESTLQMNEESSGRTNSNIQKHDTYFSGGKHFEYMLLNGSNVLLTSLQNDGPYDGPAEQVVSPKPELFTRPDFTKNNSSVENTSQNKKYLVTKPLNSSSSWNTTTPVRNNFTAITKLKRNHNSTWYSVKTGPIPEPSLWVHRPDFRKFEKPNISSPTRLYSKYENKSNENFASFTSPVVAKPVVSIYSDGSIPETEEKSARKQNYDYDDSFTKLLISNGILKPDNKDGWRNVIDSSSSTSSSSTEKMYFKVPKKFTAGNSITNMPNNSFSSTYTQILKDRRPSVNTETTLSSQNDTKTSENTWNENNVTHLPITSRSQESSTKDLAVDSIQAGIPSQHELSTKSSAGITSNSIGDLNVDESPREASAESNTLSIITTNKSRVNNEIQSKLRENYQPPKKYPIPIVKKNFFPDTMIFNNLVQNENSAKPFNAKNLTRDQPVKISVKSYSNKVDDVSNENFPLLTKFYQIPSSKVIDDKINKDAKEDTKNKTVTEFKNLVEKSLQQLFLPVAKFFSNYRENLPGNTHIDDKVKNFKLNIDDSKDVKVTLKSFTFTNLVEVLKNKSKNHKQNEPQLLRFDRDLADIESRDSIFNWTDLNNGKNINLEDSINELFSEDDAVHWFVLLLAGNSTIAEMRKEDFIKYLKVNLAARLSLEYNDIKINAILVVPPNLMVNVSFPANESSVNINEEVNIEENQKIGSIHELAETNATLLELSGQEYHVVQLLCLKSQQSVQNSLPQTARVIDRKHDDIEFYIFLIVGAICMFGVISPILYTLYKLIQKRLTTYTFKIPDIFREKIKPPPHEKINESTCESLNVIFSEDFDRKYSSTSWFDNTQHSSSILKPSSEVPPAFFVPKDESFTDFCDITRNPIENSPRLSKENKLNMLGCRPSCVLLPHQGRYQIDSEYDPDKYFDNPNYSHDAR